MRKRNSFIAAALVGLTLVTIPLVAAAQRLHHGGTPGLTEMSLAHGRHFRFLKNELNLTETQVTQLEAIIGQVREENATHREEMHGDLKEVAKILIVNPDHVARAESVLASNDTSRQQMRQNILRGVANGLSVLTPQQRTQLGQLLAKHTREH